MANKFINNMCYFNYEEYMGNMNKTPYHFVLSIEKAGQNSNNVYIETVDLHGQDQTLYLAKSSLYKNVKVMPYDELFYKTLLKSVFIKN